MKKILILLLVTISLQLAAQNVGIGTTTPAFKLDVNGRMRVKTGTLGNAGTSSGIWFEDFRDGSNRIFVGMRDSIRVGFYGTGNGGIGWDFVFNAQNGNVGVGIVTPAQKLSLNGTLGFYSGSDDYGGRMFSDVNDLHIRAKTGPINGIRGNLILQSADPRGTEFAGNIGIGVDSPKAKLHIASNVMIGSGSPASGYMLSINGKVISEEVRVELDGDWPDYVFDKEYKLSSLQELEKFITTKKHLPNIPAASQVAKEGFDLGDMNRRLLEKIEELTLYIIQQEKKLNSLHQQINMLQTKKR